MQRTLAVALILLTTLLGPTLSSTSAQSSQSDLQAAADAAQRILQMAADHEFNAMYDLIHPDAQAIVPRVATVGAFTEIYTATQAGTPQITGAQFATWTWGVTGQTYANAAEIAFEQPYVVDGETQTLRDKMYLVNDDGEWRWFFGSTPEFVHGMIEKYGMETLPPLVEGNLLENVVFDLNDYWREVLDYTDIAYVTPGVVLVNVGDSVQTGCGPASTGFWAFYCPPDSTLYLDESLLDQLTEQADFAAAFVVAHEWAHHVQTTVGFRRVAADEEPTQWNDVFSVELELMADCFSGAWMRDLYTRDRLEIDDLDETIGFTVQMLGDPPGVGTYDPQAHGSAEMRSQAINDGYSRGFLGCNIVI